MRLKKKFNKFLGKIDLHIEFRVVFQPAKRIESFFLSKIVSQTCLLFYCLWKSFEKLNNQLSLVTLPSRNLVFFYSHKISNNDTNTIQKQREHGNTYQPLTLHLT